MKRYMIFIALAALLLPAILRGLWFYRGIPSRPAIATPDYQSFTAPQPPIQPTSANPGNVKQMGGTVLLDTAHGNQFQPSEIQTLNDEIEKRGGQVESLADGSSLETRLKYARAYITISPSLAFSTEELRILQAYVNRGGRLIVFTDATRGVTYYDYNTGNALIYPDTNSVNPLLAPFDIVVKNDYLYNTQKNEGNFRNVFFDSFGKNELTFGLKQVTFYGSHSVKSLSGLVLLQGAAANLSSLDDAHDPSAGGAALSNNGNVLAFGDFTFLTSPYNTYADNPTLIANIADYALGGQQKVTLANFPYIFSGNTVQVYLTSEVQNTAEMISTLGRLQAALQFLNIDMQIVDKAPTGGDAIILGTFTPSDDLTPYTDAFDLTLDDTSESVDLKGFGNIGKAGNGVMLFNTSQKGNTLVLLSDGLDNLTTLIDTISSGSLYGCFLQDSIGICGVGYGGSYSTGTPESTESPATSEPTTSGEATPTPIPGE